MENPKEELGSISRSCKEVISNQLQQVEELRQETQGYICPQTKKQCDDECCVSAEHCHIEDIFGIISDCEQLKQETLEEFSRRRFNEQKLDTYTSYNIEDAIKEGAK